MHYLLEDAYIFEENSPHVVKSLDFLSRCARITCRCLVRWADWYRASSIIHGGAIRQGALPDSQNGREGLVDDIFNWFEGSSEPLTACTLILYQEDIHLFHAGDGLPGMTLALTDEQWMELRQCLDRHGLPIDLFYRADEQKVVVEPVLRADGVIRTVQHYSPRCWRQRMGHDGNVPSMPSERQRIEGFSTDIERFQAALRRRLAEMNEPGAESDHELLSNMVEISLRLEGLDQRVKEELQGLTE